MPLFFVLVLSELWTGVVLCVIMQVLALALGLCEDCHIVPGYRGPGNSEGCTQNLCPVCGDFIGSMLGMSHWQNVHPWASPQKSGSPNAGTQIEYRT